MPYIKNTRKDKDRNTYRRRDVLDAVVSFMNTVEIKADGDLNYVLYAFCKRHIKPSYNNFKNFCGELRQCATEIERRLLADYEEKKCEENGDVI